MNTEMDIDGTVASSERRISIPPEELLRASTVSRRGSSLFAIKSQVEQLILKEEEEIDSEGTAKEKEDELPTDKKNMPGFARSSRSESARILTGQLEELITRASARGAKNKRESNATASTEDASHFLSESSCSRPSYASSSRSSYAPTGRTSNASSLEYTVPESSKLRGGLRLSQAAPQIPLNVKLTQIGLFGRQAEVEQLQNCLKQQWDACTQHEGAKRNLIWIAGEGGTGKSSLVDSALNQSGLVSQRGGLFLVGKCDSQSKGTQQQRQRPFEAIAMACDDLCVQLLASKGHNPDAFSQLETTLQEQMGQEEAALLKRLIPGLHPILESVDATCEYHTSLEVLQEGSNLPTQEAKHQFHFVFGKFIKIVAKSFPLVLMIDDLQWADMACLEILQTLALDPDPAMVKLLLVGCYRDDEVDEQHRLVELQGVIPTPGDEGNNNSLQVTTLRLGNLSVEILNPLLAQLLDLDPPLVLPLTQICHKRTNGNPFFFVQFVLTLWKDKRIKYDYLLTNRYQWDLAEIEDHSQVADNVVAFLSDRLAALPQTTQQLLMVASCLGVEFDAETFRLVMRDIHKPANGEDGSYTQDLQLAVEEGVLEIVPIRTVAETSVQPTLEQQSDCQQVAKYRWVHDKIVEAAQGLLDVEELPKLKVCIGEILVRSFDQARLEEELFMVVNLLNEDMTRSKRPTQLAELNLRAAKKAASLSSFEGAAHYCSQGLALLPAADSKWTAHYMLALQLHSMMADMLSVLGDHEGTKREAMEVLDRQRVPLLDRIPTHEVLMNSLFRQNKEQEAQDMGCDMLAQLGVKLPKNKVWATVQLLSGVKKHTSQADKLCDNLRALQVTTDAIQTIASRYLITTCKFATVTGSPYLVLAPMKMIACAMKSGLAEDTALAIAVVGMIITEIGGDIQAGSKYANLALELADRIKSPRRFPEVLMYANGFVLHHTKPVHLLLKPLLRAYNLCLQTGNVDHAAYTIHAYLLIAFRSGKSLAALEADLAAYTKQIQQLKVLFVSSLANLLWQTVMNLVGIPCFKPTVLTGAAMNEDKFLEAKPDPFSLGMYHAYHSQLYALFGDHKQSAKLSIARKGPLGIPGSAFAVMDVCYRAVSVFATARTTKKLKYKRHAKSLKSQVDKWASAGDPNVVHFKHLLDAELAVLKGKSHEAELHYETAITAAARHGFVQDAALFNERMAEFYQRDLKDLSSASFRFQEAIRIYADWGAQSKVDDLTEKTSSLLQMLEDDHPGQIYLDADDQSSASGFSTGFFSSSR